jgi:UDP-galactopyranose mutase
MKFGVLGFLLLALARIHIADADVSNADYYPKQRSEWRKFYKEQFGLEKGFGSVNVPKPLPGFNRLIFVAKEMTAGKIFEKISELENTHCAYDDLEKARFSSLITKDYAFWVKDEVEATLSVKAQEREAALTIRLEERLLYELKYFLETKKHLDVKGFTHSVASRDQWGNYPIVDWLPNSGTFRIQVGNPWIDIVSTREVVR